jgi:hypothetical protein
MKNNFLSRILLVIISTIVLIGCGRAPALASDPTAVPIQEEATATIPATPTPDACSPGQIEEEVFRVNRHMREFDDAATLATNIPQVQLSNSIADLQRIRREAEDEPIPACLTDLKQYQVSHMNTVIGTLIAFMRSSDPMAIQCSNPEPNTEAQAICQNIGLARQQHDQYLLELARLLGLTVVPATPGAAPSETPIP